MNVLVNDESLKNIADAIRAKKNSTEKYMPGQMGPAIKSIDVGRKSFTIVQVSNGHIGLALMGSVISNAGDEYTLSFPPITFLITANNGYTPGHITVNGVDQGSNKVTLEVTDGMVISATAAVKDENTQVGFMKQEITLQQVNGGYYSYSGSNIKDTTGAYTLESYVLSYDAEKNRIKVSNVQCSAFASVNALLLQFSQDANSDSATFDLDTTQNLAEQEFVVGPNFNLNPTQPFTLSIVLVGTLA
jgi:hypothetical protein